MVVFVYELLSGCGFESHCCHLKTEVFKFLKNTMYTHRIPLIKSQNLWKRKIHITQHCAPNSIYGCILPLMR